MNKIFVNTLRLSVGAVFALQLVGCGTLMYPERRGQRGGSVDAGVAVLDGIGLLFGIIPGVIAFAVDFSNGTIYLPGGPRLGLLDLKNIKQVKFDPKHSSLASIERTIQLNTGYAFRFDQDNIRLSKLRSLKDMMEQFAKAEPINNNDRIALL